MRCGVFLEELRGQADGRLHEMDGTNVRRLGVDLEELQRWRQAESGGAEEEAAT
jgi:hypothetical protein